MARRRREIPTRGGNRWDEMVLEWVQRASRGAVDREGDKAEEKDVPGSSSMSSE